MKKISILGSTGSIGINALNVIDNLEGQFDVVALSANKNGKRLVKQAKKYHPDSVAIIDTNEATYVESALKNLNISILKGREGLLELSSRNDLDIMMNGLVGSSGMEPTLNAIQAGVDVALSNKESLVMAGEIIRVEKEKSGAQLFPIDSEHSAIWQCLSGESIDDINPDFVIVRLPDYHHIIANRTQTKRAPDTGALLYYIASADHRLENWKLLRAFGFPYFLRSTTRESRVRKPPFFSTARSGGSNFTSAREIPWRTAPACPDSPPPETVHLTSNCPFRSDASKG